MLYKSLKFYGSEYIETILVNFAGVCSNFFAFLKTIKKLSYAKIVKKDKERKEEKMKVEFEEEEKKSKYLFYDEVLSIDDSDLEENPNKLEKNVKRFNQGRFGILKSTMTSTHNVSQSNKSNNERLKHVKSSHAIYKTGIISDLKNENDDKIS